jgi:peptidoglycan/LPS O-acetylase OafA/YrhL
MWLLAAALPVLVYPWITETHRYIAGVDIFEYSRLGQMFLSGALLGCLWNYWKDYAVPVGIAAFIVGLAVNAAVPFNSFVDAIAVAAATIGLGSSRLMSWFSRGGDGSYGMYIYAWPIQQFSIMYIDNFWLSMVVAAAATIAVGYTTWHLFEKRCMTHVADFADVLRRMSAKLLRSQSVTLK